MVDREQLAWAAGFFDGEGHTNTKTRKNPSLSIAQVDVRLLQRFQRAVLDLGHINGPYKYTPRQQPHYQWNTHKREHVQAVIVMLWEWLGQYKRDQAMKALQQLAVPNKKPGTKMKRWCKRGHQLGVTRYVTPGGHNDGCYKCRNARNIKYYAAKYSGV